MTPRDDVVRRYLDQRREMGETTVVMPNQSKAPSADPNPPSRAPVVEVKTEATTQPNWRRDAPPIPTADGVVIPPPPEDLFRADPLAGMTLPELEAAVRACQSCRLGAERTHAVPGEGPPDARLMVIGEGPGANEDAQGRPFVGRAGDLLNDILAAIDCPREQVYIANIVKCRPPKNRNPEREEIDACLPYLFRQIELVRPDVILALGSVAACTLLESKGSLGALRNRVHRFRDIPLVVTYHPAALLRNPNWKKPTWDDVRIARRLLAGER